MEPHSSQQRIRELPIARGSGRKDNAAEFHTFRGIGAKGGEHLSRIEPRRSNLHERGVGPPTHRKGRSLKQAQAGIVKEGLNLRQVWARRMEGEPGFVVGAISIPACNGKHPEGRSQMKFRLGQSSQLSQGHSVTHRNSDAADRRTKRRVKDIPLYHGADRVGAIKNKDLRLSVRCRLHHRHHGVEPGEIAGPHILEVDQQQVDVTQVGKRSVRGWPIKAIDWETGCGINRGGHRGTRGCGTSKTMFRSKDGNQVYSMSHQQIDSTPTVPVHPALIGQQPDAFTQHHLEAVLHQHLQPRADPNSGLGVASQPVNGKKQRHQTFVPHRFLLATSLVFGCTPAPTSVTAVRPIADTILARLTIRERAAQLLMPQLPGNYTAFDTEGFARIRAWIDTLQVGGVIASTGSPADIALRLNDLQTRSNIPLLVGSDLEGGTAFRLLGGTEFPTNMGVAATGREDDAYAMGWITAEEARAVGIHVAFAPVADVNSNPDNPIINTRSFGADPHAVGRFVAATVRGMEDHGLFATVKHFPGHGDTETDTHLGLPIISRDWNALDSVELPPFRAAIAQGVTGVMSAHIALPRLTQSETPATLSQALLTGMLRDSLGFQGIVVTDALDMAALAGPLRSGEIAVRAILAGADLLLMPTDPQEALEAVVAAVASGRISEARLNASVRRLLLLKERAGLFRDRLVSLPQMGTVVGRQSHVDTARAVTGRALVLVQEQHAAFRRLRIDPAPLTLVTYSEGDNDLFGQTLHRRLRAQGRTVRFLALTPESGARSYGAIGEPEEQSFPVVLAIAVRARAGAGQLELPQQLTETIDSLAQSGRPVHLISFGSPYIVRAFTPLTSYLIAWSASALAEGAVADVFEGAPVTGRLPVPIPGVAPLGAGMDIPNYTWLSLDRLLDSAITRGAAPGAVVGVSLRGLRHTYGTGHFGTDDAIRPDDGTIYDLASLTKVVGLTTLLMVAVDSGRIDLDTPVVRYLPRFTGPLKDQVTIRHLLVHASGLPAWRPFYREVANRAELIRQVESTPLDTVPGARTTYSDLGIILLTAVVEQVFGDLSTAVQRMVTTPLGLHSTMFNPPSSLAYRVPPTEDDPWRGHILRGEVHDENAARMDGVSGHAGLFGSTDDLLTFGEWILRELDSRDWCLHRGLPACAAPPPPTIVGEFARKQGLVPGSTRALGWDTPATDGTGSAGRLLSARSIGHTGFTGTSLWIDPERGLVIVLLSNRVHPTRETPSIGALRRAIADLAVTLVDQQRSDAR